MRARVYAASLIPSLFACYTNRPVIGALEPSSKVAVMLTDVGRVEEASRLGQGVFRVEGALVAATDTDYLVSVSGVQPIRGAFVRWAGETVTVRRAHVAQAYERRLSPVRTALAAGGALGVVVAVVLTSDLLGFGNEDIPIVPPPPDPPTQRRTGQ